MQKYPNADMILLLQKFNKYLMMIFWFSLNCMVEVDSLVVAVAADYKMALVTVKTVVL